MAASNHRRGRGWAACLGACCVLTAAAAIAAVHDREQPINLEAASSDFDYKNNTLLFRRVKITQGELQVEADEARATGLNFENSEWNLLGQVRILVPEGRLTSSQASVLFRDNEIVRAVISGKPAKFQQRLKDGGQLAQGEADGIEYDVRAGTVRLSGGAWLSDGNNEIRGDTLIYNIGAQRVVANPEEKDPGGVRITITPGKPPGGTDDQKNKKKETAE